MNKLVDKLFKGIDYFTGILTGLMVFFVFLNVVLRTFFNAGLTWSEELARYDAEACVNEMIDAIRAEGLA